MTMSKSFLLPALLAVATSYLASTVSGDEAPMIVGGEKVGAGVYPYYVQVLSTRSTMCGGTLIAPDVVLTAAHCGWAANGKNILEGGVMKVGAVYKNNYSGGAVERKCDHYEEHPDYVPDGKEAGDQHDFVDYDFALCKLNKPVDMDDWDVELKLNFKRNVPVANEKVTAIGLGRTSFTGSTPNQLKHADVPVANKCYLNFDNDIKICAGGRGEGVCFGDSGGPLVRKEGNVHYHIGVTSGTVNCEQSTFPGFFARTSAVQGWIEDTVCNVFESDGASFCTPAPPTDAPAPRCENDEGFYLHNIQTRTCAWIAKNPSRIAQYCKKKAVSESCPETCSSIPAECVEAPPSDEPVPAPPTDEPVPAPPTDEPVPAPPTDEPVPAPPTDEPVPAPPTDEPVPAPPTDEPVSGPRCKNDPDFYWKSKTERTCAWIAKNPKRISNYCKTKLVRESCPETCSSIPAECVEAPPTDEPVPAPPTDEPVPAPPTDEPVPAPPTDEPVPAPPTDEPVPAPPTDAPALGCKNDEGYYWETYEIRTCAWIAKNPKRIKSYCKKADDVNGGKLVSEVCPESCNSIPAECVEAPPTDVPVPAPPTEVPVPAPPTDEPVPAPPTDEPVSGPICKNDPDYYWKHKEERTCAWISKNPKRIANYCKTKLTSESCPETCSSIPAECTTTE